MGPKHNPLSLLSILLAMLWLFFMAASGLAVEPAPGPEDVPKLGGEDIGGKAVKKPTPNRPPRITNMSVFPSRPMVGVNVVKMSRSGSRMTVKVTVTATDPDGDELTYTYSDSTRNPDVTGKYNIVRYRPKRAIVIKLTVTVKDPYGGWDKETVIIPIFDPNDELINQEIRESQRSGYLKDGRFRGTDVERVMDGDTDEALRPSPPMPPSALARLGRRWTTASELGWSGVWTRRGNSNVFDATWTHPRHGRVTATLTINVDARNNVIIRRTGISSTKRPPGWAPGKTCIYRGKMDAASKVVTGTTSCEWARGPFRWSARIDRRDEDGVATGKGCTALVGNWKWFNGARVSCRRDGTCIASNGYQGKWRCTGKHGRFEISWSRPGRGTEFVDTVSLSRDGRRITGKNQFGGSVSASRQATAPTSGDRRQTDTRTQPQKPTMQPRKPACKWRFTGMVSDYTAADDPPFSFDSSTPVPARCHRGYAGNTATCWDGVRIRHPGSPTRAWCTYKHVPKSAYGRGGAPGKVYECVCR